MKKIFLIIEREYLTRVKKKSFLLMTILGPILLAAVAIVPVWISGVADKTRTIVVVDETHSFRELMRSTQNLRFDYNFIDANIDSVKSIFKNDENVSILFIPKNIMASNNAILYSTEQPGVQRISYLSSSLSSIIEKSKMELENVDPSIVDKVKTTIHIKNSVDDETSDVGLNTAVGLLCAVLIYMFIFIYAAQVMRGVMEEKTSRIVEIIISSVKPFQLMMGKIIGVALVGLTQFVVWIVLSLTLFSVSQNAFMKSRISSDKIEHVYKTASPDMEQKFNKVEMTEKGKEIFSNILRINWPLIISSFLFYFLFGYLTYSALFAAIGAAVDSEADTQQFMLPITIPLILCFSLMNNIIENPDGPIAFWLSIFPLTSPLAMMMRIPFGIQAWELALSMSVLIGGFIGTTWIAGKIYRTGILLYGKKITYKELWKWLFYKS
ncbi:MAG: ABC transporter permease [Bacteroidetes bacterium]|nr:ABC transporter permease [Bacteroidota bacterium]